MADELPGVDDYLTLLDKAYEIPWRSDQLFKEPKEADDVSGTGDRDDLDTGDN